MSSLRSDVEEPITAGAAGGGAPARRRPVRARAALDRWTLIAVLLVFPLACAIADLSGPAHNLQRLGENLVSGISNGTIWALIAVGYTLVYGIIELINFAHGDVFMIGSFVAAGLFGTLGLTLTTGSLGLVAGLAVALVICMLVCGALNFCIEQVAYKPLRDAPRLAPLITAVGFSFILQNVGLLWLGGGPASLDDLLRQHRVVFTVAGVDVSRGDLLAVGVTVPIVGGLAWFVGRTRAGKAMRATAQQPEAARLMGINVDRTISLTFVVGGLLAGAAGLIYALYQTTIWYFQGFRGGLFAFTAAVMGGIGNLRGAVLGGLIIGVLQELSDNRISPDWTDAVIFGYLILIMTIRPRGLLGEQTREAG